jgi:hypothetical protein
VGHRISRARWRRSERRASEPINCGGQAYNTGNNSLGEEVRIPRVRVALTRSSKINCEKDRRVRR